MWKVKIGLVVLWLLFGAWMDIRKREIPVWYILLGVLVGGICFGMEGAGVWKQKGFGAAVGGCFLLSSYITRERMGYGDSLMIGLLGIMLGVWELAEVLSVAFLLLGIVAGYCFVRKKQIKVLPFLPFLAAGYIGALCI